MVNCIVMASGYGRRLGLNKLLLSYNGKKLIEYTLDNILKCKFNSRLVIAKDKDVIKIAEDKGLKVVKNNKSILGQSESMKLGIKNSPKGDGYMFFTGDQPLLEVNTINSLIYTFNKNKENIIVPRYKNRNGSPVIFPFKFINELNAIKGDRGGREVIKKNVEDVVFFDVKHECELMDIDTWEDYEKLQLQRNDNLC